MDVANEKVEAAGSVQSPNKLPHPWDYWNRCTEAGAPTIGRVGWPAEFFIHARWLSSS
jgi:hypothetical protein